MNLRKILTGILLVLVGTASAEVTSGFYRIRSNSYAGRYITENRNDMTLVTSSLNESNYSQVWSLTVDGNKVSIMNALTERYVQKATGNAWSVQYTTGTSEVTFTLGESDGTVYFGDKWDGGPHCAASQSYDVVLWSNNADASKWVLEPITLTPDFIYGLQAQKISLYEASVEKLQQFFTTTACTSLKSEYAVMSDADLTTAMNSANIPATTLNMALKVKNNSWATYGSWDKTERTFRIADYKAYSSGWRWQGIMGYDRALGRLSNPTGIWADEGDYLQVYVGDIPQGETVKLEVAGYGQGTGSTYTLHEGMNILQVYSAGNCFVFYEVDNTTNGKSPYTALSDYSDVTVHIQGGTVQGYFDQTKGDDNDDWTQLKAYLMSKDMFCLKSRSLVFNLQTGYLRTAVDEAPGGSTGKVVEMMNYWQGIQDMEDGLFNRNSIATSSYCNNIHSVTTVGNWGDGSLYATTYGIFFSPEQHNRLFNYKLFSEGSDNLWASAHELGHHRQGIINMVGCTEVSNNIYSNVAVYQQGRYTSRTASIQTVFSDFMSNLSWPERVRLANTSGYSGNYNQQLLHLNWSLYMFFHINGNKTDFFPKLFDALRNDPMSKTEGAQTLTAANTDYLKYYVKCCQVSGYDLTDFFASYGFFMLPPEQESQITYNNVTTNRYQTIGDYGTYNLYVTQEMIDDAKAQVAAMNLPGCNIEFIEDRVTAPDATYAGHATGEKKQSNAVGAAIGTVGEMGQYTDFDKPCSAYSYNAGERGTVTTVGTGAVGFKVYDNTGNLVGLYNTTTFILPQGLTDYTIKAAAGNGSEVEVVQDESIDVREFPSTDMWYSFNAKRAVGRYVESKGVGAGIVSSLADTPSNSMQWKFVLRDGEEECFDIVNRDDNTYIDPTATFNTQIYTTATRPERGWRVTAAGDYYIITSGSTQFNLTEWSYSYKLFNWGGGGNTSDEGCLFTIAQVEPITMDVTLNTVDNASYATFYFNQDMQTDANTTAYYIVEAQNGRAKLTATDNSGRDIPSRTAVVLVNQSAASQTTLTYISKRTPVVAEDVNLLKGTLSDITLDLSDNTSYYSLGRKNDNIGFYKFDKNGNYTITLAANKAYLDTQSAASSARGFAIDLDGILTAINSVEEQSCTTDKAGSIVYDLVGRRINDPKHGIYIVNGKKVLE